MAKQHDKQFKLDAVQYYQDHKDLGVRGCAENLGIGYSTLTKWLKDFRESGDIPVRGSGNYASDEQKVYHFNLFHFFRFLDLTFLPAHRQ